jgi:calcium/calmodulin-dependent protein kinase I
VRQATNKVTGEIVAVKCVDFESLAADDEEQLHQEVAVLKIIDHPHVLKFYGFYMEAGTGEAGLSPLSPDSPLADYKHKKMYYLVTECLKGGELFNRIVHKTFYSEKDARNVIFILLQTIAYLHHHRIVHRDLKPENLLLYADDDTSIKIADFGFAERTDGFISLKTQCGTPGYVAPEILLGLPYGKSVDMWAIGVIIYVLLGGYPPFEHTDNQAVIDADFGFHPDQWDDITDDAKDLIKKLLRKDPLERWSAEEALKHPWMTHDEADLSSNLGANLEVLQKKFRKFKGAVKAIIATRRISKVLANNLSADKGTLDNEDDIDTQSKLELMAADKAMAKEKAERVRMEDLEKADIAFKKKQAADDESLRAAMKAAKEKEEEIERIKKEDESKSAKQSNFSVDTLPTSNHVLLTEQSLHSLLEKDNSVVEAGSFFDLYTLGDMVSVCLLFE